MKTYWKIQFDGEFTGEGWLEFDEFMIAQNIYDLDGNVITDARDYHPIEFNTKPEWAE